MVPPWCLPGASLVPPWCLLAVVDLVPGSSLALSQSAWGSSGEHIWPKWPNLAPRRRPWDQVDDCRDAPRMHQGCTEDAQRRPQKPSNAPLQLYLPFFLTNLAQLAANIGQSPPNMIQQVAKVERMPPCPHTSSLFFLPSTLFPLPPLPLPCPLFSVASPLPLPSSPFPARRYARSD